MDGAAAALVAAALTGWLACGPGIAAAQPLEPPPPGERAPVPPNADVKPAPSPATDAAMASLADRPIREIRISGLNRTERQLVTNQIRSRVSTPLNPETVRADVQRLNRLGRFKAINASVQAFDDGSVLLSYEFVETPIIEDVQAVGNRQLTDTELAPAIGLLKGTPVDEFQLGAARAAIEKLYRDRGYYQATVTIDQKELDSTGIVLFRISEGERVRVTDIRYEGAASFTPGQLESAIKTREAGLFESGPVDQEQLDRDVASLVEFYRDRGHLDVRADRQVTFSPNGREAIVTFVIEEGPVYTLKKLRAELADDIGRPSGRPPAVFSVEQLSGLMEIKAGDVYSVDKVRRSLDSVRNAYAQMGYVDAGVARAELRDTDKPEVELLLLIREGERYTTGLISMRGNELTQQKVIRRELENRPERPLDTSSERRGERVISNAELRLEETRLFEPSSPKVTVQPEDPQNPGVRDVLVEVKETNTGSIGLGAGISSDGGVIGQISLQQRNFDLFDTPDSVGEFLSGRAFRGAGQSFNLTLAPGTEVQTYSIGLSDPALFDTDYTGAVQGFYRRREFDEYREDRLSGRFSLGRRFGERWTGSLNFRYDNIKIEDIEASAPVDLFEVDGTNDLTGLGFELARTTVDSRFRPTRGSRLEFGVERVGVAGGDFNFTRLSASHTVFFTVYQDFLDYKTVLSLKTSAAYIPEGKSEAPIFERLYLGGQSFRGFRFRTISPKGIRNDNGEIGDDPRGGTFSFFFGPELTYPLYEDVIALAAFIDTGTVTDRAGFADYRVSGGFGLRLFVEALGPVPLSFDFGFPIVKEEGDRERVFSFSLDLPF